MNSMHASKPSSELLHSDTLIQRLKELIEQWKFEAFEIRILEALVSRDRWVKADVPNTDKSNTKPWDEVEKIETAPTRQNNQLGASELANGITKWDHHFLIYWTDWKSPWHCPQYTSFQADKHQLPTSLFDSSDKIPEMLRNKNSTMIVRLVDHPTFPNHKCLTLRVSDNRTDHRGWSHTTVAIFLPTETKREYIEWLSRDLKGIKVLMKTILEKADSPLKWAEAKVTESVFL